MSYINSNHYDDYKTDTPDNALRRFCRCASCDEDISYGEYCILVLDEAYVHEDCLMDYLKGEFYLRYLYAGE